MKFQPTTVRAFDEVGVGVRTSDFGFRLRVISDFQFEILDIQTSDFRLEGWSS